MKRYTTLRVFVFLFTIIFFQNAVLSQQVCTSGSIAFAQSGPCNFVVDYRIEKDGTLGTVWYKLVCKIRSNDCFISEKNSYTLKINYICTGESNETKDLTLSNKAEWSSFILCYDKKPSDISILNIKFTKPENQGELIMPLQKTIVFIDSTAFSLPKDTAKTEKWSEWFSWKDIACYSDLKYSVRYTTTDGIKSKWEVKFKNNYTEDIYFNYVLEPYWKKHEVSSAEFIQPNKASEEIKANKIWATTEPGGMKIEDMTVTVFNLSKGKDNWYKSPPIYYSDCFNKDTVPYKDTIFNKKTVPNKVSGPCDCDNTEVHAKYGILSDCENCCDYKGGMETSIPIRLQGTSLFYADCPYCGGACGNCAKKKEFNEYYAGKIDYCRHCNKCFVIGYLY